ncbi:CaiB/BaiF CoA transferase family protein [Novosphingobium bradum]|uniref:CaiB/BaiF CoA transferase family protein n=1 Tax=Novosphingobium bradum TaxID=1737444 RepID=A0ABV7IMF3_9SPHN
MLQPLAGLKVLDFTAFPPGAICTVLLADLGAEVIRVESPAQKGKPSLVLGQLPMSRAKRSIALDLRNPAANAVLLRLAASADVVIENAKPGSMEQRGFGYAQAKAVNPRIIWCAITGFGQTGPNADHSGHDISYLAHSGLLTQMNADPAFHPGIQMAVPYGAMAAVIGVQGALLERARTGEGAFIDIALSEAATWVLTGGVNALAEKPYIIAATPDRHRYACADGREVAIACSEPRTWAALCDGLGLPELKDKLYRWGDEAGAIIATIGGVFATRPAADWVAMLAPGGAAVTMVNHAAQLLSDPQVVARGTIADCAGTPVPGNPVRITAGGQSTGTRGEAPHAVGEDTAAVLAEAGFSAEEIAGLEQAGLL